MAFDHTTLDLFARIAGGSSFSKAAKLMGLSPTAATQRIQALEADLGVKLLNRTTRAVSLTPEGQIFLGHAKAIMTSMEDARTDLAGGITNIKGELRITGPASFRHWFLVPHVAEFLKLYPDVTIHLDITDRVVDIVEEGIDVAFRVGVLASSTLMARKLMDNPRLLVASPQYLADYGVPLTPQDLAQHNCIVLGRADHWRLSSSDGVLHDIQVSGNLATSNGGAMTEATVAGVGIGIKSFYDIQDYLSAGSLIPVLPTYTIEPQWAIWAVRPPNERIPARVRVFIDFIAEKLKTSQQTAL